MLAGLKMMTLILLEQMWVEIYAKGLLLNCCSEDISLLLEFFMCVLEVLPTQ